MRTITSKYICLFVFLLNMSPGIREYIFILLEARRIKMLISRVDVPKRQQELRAIWEHHL